jgi:hypothetical protein
MAAVHQDRQLNRFGPPEIVEGIQSSAHGPATEKDIIHQYHDFAIYVEWNDGRLNLGRRALPEVIPMHRNIERTYRDRVAEDRPQGVRQPMSQVHPTPLDANQDDIRRCFVVFGNLVSNSR